MSQLVSTWRSKSSRVAVVSMNRAKASNALSPPFAESPDLWLGDQGKRFGYDGLGRALRRRARIAGIAEFRPHRLRHTAAHRWLAKGGSESGLMAIAGWTRTDMLVRYTRARASERAAQEAQRLNLGDLGTDLIRLSYDPAS
jgi:integrase